MLSRILLALCTVFASSCATSFVRSDSADHPEHIYPATVFDAGFIWDAGIKGNPLIGREDLEDKIDPLTRVVFVAGGFIDLPFSLLFDTVFLPHDLSRPSASDESNQLGEQDTAGQSATAE